MADDHQPQGSSGAALVSDDPLDFAEFIVYMRKKRKPNETQEQQAFREACQDHPEIVIKYVEEIAHRDYPPWLTGVPTVVSLPSFDVSTGTKAMQKILKWSAKRPMGTQAMSHSGSVLSAPLQMVGDLIPPEERDDDSSQLSSCTSIEELLRRREALGGGPKRGRA